MLADIDIRKLLPQREPILVVDCLMEAGEGRAVTSFTVPEGHVFLEDDGTMAEVGLMENIAQSASALAGYAALLRGAEVPPVGYIGEIKRFQCLSCPHVGETLETTVTFGAEVGGVSIVDGEVRVGEMVIARTKMKIFVA